jgi:hypothetical protein
VDLTFPLIGRTYTQFWRLLIPRRAVEGENGENGEILDYEEPLVNWTFYHKEVFRFGLGEENFARAIISNSSRRECWFQARSFRNSSLSNDTYKGADDARLFFESVVRVQWDQPKNMGEWQNGANNGDDSAAVSIMQAILVLAILVVVLALICGMDYCRTKEKHKNWQSRPGEKLKLTSTDPQDYGSVAYIDNIQVDPQPSQRNKNNNNNSGFEDL